MRDGGVAVVGAGHRQAQAQARTRRQCQSSSPVVGRFIRRGGGFRRDTPMGAFRDGSRAVIGTTETLREARRSSWAITVRRTSTRFEALCTAWCDVDPSFPFPLEARQPAFPRKAVLCHVGDPTTALSDRIALLSSTVGPPRPTNAAF